MNQISLPQLQCKRCNHKWTPRKEEVKRCPQCRTIFFAAVKVVFTCQHCNHSWQPQTRTMSREKIKCPACYRLNYRGEYGG